MLLFGTELGKSVKDLTQASKVTSKVTKTTAVVTLSREGQNPEDHFLY